jgi:hypothetical protein
LPRRIDEERFPFLVELASPWNGDSLDLDGFQWTGLGEGNGNLRVQSLATPFRTFVLMWVPQHERLVARARRKPRLIVPGSADSA